MKKEKTSMSSFLTAITFVCAWLCWSTTKRMKATGKIFLMNQISMMTSCCRAKYAT
ncbi:hypothetical protein UUU_10420 [Klebsiella pneumoniae subsp. pneumoniae DSM 30104 = JCM 1662 = NBRC 14940]|nr:hypothetical protein UUU_10420 [Klebsiella pneumoniae subsp. pneumoniae DSM 30104 = JCM 1662 = NBRC 14940]